MAYYICFELYSLNSINLILSYVMKKFYQKALISNTLKDISLTFLRDDTLPIVLFTFNKKPVIVGMGKIIEQENTLYIKAEILDEFPFNEKENFFGVAGEFVSNRNSVEAYFINHLLYLVSPKIVG